MVISDNGQPRQPPRPDPSTGRLPFLIFAAALLLAATPIPAALLAAGQPVPSDLAKGNFRSDGAYSFRVDLKSGWPVLGRTSNLLPTPRQNVPPAYAGETQAVLRVVFEDGPPRKPPRVERPAWDHQRAVSTLNSGKEASLIFSRLTPAVLITTPASQLSFTTPAPPAGRGLKPGLRYLAWPTARGLAVHRVAALGEEAFAFARPWVLAWFGTTAPLRGYTKPADVDSRRGVSRSRLGAADAETLDIPLLFRFEREPSAIRAESPNGIRLTFNGAAGRIALMPLLGSGVVLPAETEKWSKQIPHFIESQCGRWAEFLGHFPLTVRETFSVDGDAVSVRQEFQWVSLEHGWPCRRAAPLPPMLALAFDRGGPVTFRREGGFGVTPRPLSLNRMDTPGLAKVILGADAYTYRIGGLADCLASPRRTTPPPSPQARFLRDKLERHVADMVAAGHLRPLLCIYGGIGGTRFAHYYWVGAAELAHALAMAFPHLSPGLQAKVKAYLKAEWKAYPPFKLDDTYYVKGASRTPYEMPWRDIGRHTWLPKSRDMDQRKRHAIFDLYRAHEYYTLTGERDDPATLKAHAVRLATELLAHQDWAIMGPTRLHNVRSRHHMRYFALQGQATYDRWLAGAIGLVRLARMYGWRDLEPLGKYLVAKLAVARIGQARYVAEMHRTGLVRGELADDWRSLVHIDTTCALVGWGAVMAGVHQDQELPPFIDLVPEVGRLLGRHAREECRAYLHRLDADIPFWFLSEAPKLGATEHRTCPLQHLNGNVLAQAWILGKRGKALERYIDTTRFKGDLYTIQNLAAALDSLAQATR